MHSHISVVETAAQIQRLGSHEAEVNRVEVAVMAASRRGGTPPSSSTIFGALNEATMICAEVLDAYVDKPIPHPVRAAMSRLNCSMNNLGVSLGAYTVLTPRTLPRD